MRALRVLVMIVAVTLLAGCSAGPSNSVPAPTGLESLDATGVVRTYFESGDTATELALSPPEERTMRAQPNYAGDHERAGGVDDLLITGGAPSSDPPDIYPAYVDKRLFEVRYVSRRTNNIGEPPGQRMYFVYVGRLPGSSVWKVLGVGTGP